MGISKVDDVRKRIKEDPLKLPRQHVKEVYGFLDNREAQDFYIKYIKNKPYGAR